MMERRKNTAASWILLLCLTLTAVLMTSIISMADEDEDMDDSWYMEIESVTLEVYSDIRAGDSRSEVEVSGDEDGYTVDRVYLANEPKLGWKAGDRPEVEVTLEAGPDYYFASGFSRGDINLEGDAGSVIDLEKKASTVWVTIALDALDGEAGSESDEEEDTGKLSASNRRDESRSPVSSEEENEDSDYWEWENEEQEEDVSSYLEYENSARSGAWIYDGIGWWYCFAQGGYPVNSWLLIDGLWYYFDGAGYMASGWIFWNGEWYFCAESGEMLADTVTPDGYYVGADGAWEE